MHDASWDLSSFGNEVAYGNRRGQYPIRKALARRERDIVGRQPGGHHSLRLRAATPQNEVDMGENEWWRTFFAGVAVDLWLRAPTEEQTRSEVDFLQQALRLPHQARVLDVPCGGGRHAVELASRGFVMTGVDLSTEFLEAARSRASERGVTITWEHREMRDLPWQGEFDGAFCCGNSFGYLDDPGNVEFLVAVSRALKPGARFVIETGAVAESSLPAYQERRWYEIGGILFLVQNRYNHTLGRLETEYTFIRDGQVERRNGFQRVYTYSELCKLAETAGFGAIEGFSSVSGEPFRLGSPRLLLVATKT
jgi:SAM-dependent methyltransferase